MTSVYLDHAATTPMNEEVITEMVRIMTTVYGNPSSIHQLGRQAEFELNNAREKVAKSIGAQDDEIVFHGGGTEGDNTVLLDIARKKSKYGKHIISTNIEHSAILKTLSYLETIGFEVTYLPVDEKGQVSAKQVKDALRDETILVTVMYANNEIGSINPIQEIGAILKESPTLFHTDAVQAFGSEVIDVNQLGVDYLTASAHKINGPKGVGFTYIRKGSPVPILLLGGDQEEKKRAGTENLSGIVGLATAVSILDENKKKENKELYQKYEEIILKELDDAGIPYEINGNGENKLAHILNIWFKDVPNHVLLSRLDMRGFFVSTGSACSAGTVKPSPVIAKLSETKQQAASESVRISFGYGLKETDVRAFAKELVNNVQVLRQK